LLEIRRARDQL
jgi:hypothetical protein